MMVQTEKMMSVGGLAAGMAHEINNPLGGILQACQNIERRTSLELPKNAEVAQAMGIDLALVRRYLDERGILEFVAGIRSDGARAAEIVSDMLAFSRRSESRLAPIDLSEIVDTVLRLAANDYDLKKQYDFRNVQIVRDWQPGLPLVQCDKTKIEQVLLNLVKNAAQALAGHDKHRPPSITVRLRKEPHYLRIEVVDNGPGMDERVRRRVFEPFFTTKEVGVGTGLGLSVSYFIITKQHKGTLSVESTPGEGSRFIIRLPLRAEG
jgi:signal transduction histidine kinase